MAQPMRARRLTGQESRRLLQIVRRGKHGSVRVRRAMIIMASAAGTLVPAIARLVAAGEGTVRDVIHVFNAKGLAALDPRWAGGRPRLISDGDIEVIVAAARTRPEKPVQCFTPANASWANPIEAQSGPVRTFVMGGSDHRNHPALARKLQACLRWRTARARHPGVLAAQRRERARLRSERRQRCGRPKPKLHNRAGDRSWPAH